MEKKTCIQCGKEFEISDSEQEFFKSKNLQMPKRCKECRNANKKNRRNARKAGVKNNNIYNTHKVEPVNENKETKNTVKSIQNDHNKKNNSVNNRNSDSSNKNSGKNSTSRFGLYGLLLLILVAALAFGKNALFDTEKNSSQAITQSAGTVQTVISDRLDSDDSAAANVDYFFKNDELRAEHFEKHGGDFDYDNASQYEAGASAVVNSPEALHKLEAEDGDDVYYIESTNEFVIVSKAGYIRTYFKPSRGLEYFEDQ